MKRIRVPAIERQLLAAVERELEEYVGRSRRRAARPAGATR